MFDKYYKFNSLNKAQKIIMTVWVTLSALALVLTLRPITDGGFAPDWGQFSWLFSIITIPSYITFKIWGDKKQ